MDAVIEAPLGKPHHVENITSLEYEFEDPVQRIVVTFEDGSTEHFEDATITEVYE